MKTVQSTFAWLCAILFVVTGVAAILLFNIERSAFSADTFKQAFEKQGLYTRMPAILAEAVHTSIMQDAGAEPFLKVVTVDEWQTGITNLLPPEDLKLLSDNAVGSVFAYLNNESDTVSISLAPLKIRLAGPGGIDVVKQLIEAQPDCTAQQLMQMGLGLISGEVALCKPPDEMMNLIAPMLESQLQIITNTIPDKINLTPAGNNNADPRMQLDRIRTVMRLSPILPVSLLVLLTILAVRSATDLLKWWGYLFLITGGISFLAAVAGSPVLRLFIQSIMQRQVADLMPPAFIPFLAETVGIVAGQILFPVVIQGAVLATLGFGMVAATFILSRKA